MFMQIRNKKGSIWGPLPSYRFEDYCLTVTNNLDGTVPARFAPLTEGPLRKWITPEVALSLVLTPHFLICEKFEGDEHEMRLTLEKRARMELIGALKEAHEHRSNAEREQRIREYWEHRADVMVGVETTKRERMKAEEVEGRRVIQRKYDAVHGPLITLHHTWRESLARMRVDHEILLLREQLTFERTLRDAQDSKMSEKIIGTYPILGNIHTFPIKTRTKTIPMTAHFAKAPLAVLKTPDVQAPGNNDSHPPDAEAQRVMTKDLILQLRRIHGLSDKPRRPPLCINNA